MMETFALQKVPSREASIILATEPVWAAIFGVILVGESFQWSDYVGGALIVSACFVNSIEPSDDDEDTLEC